MKDRNKRFFLMLIGILFIAAVCITAACADASTPARSSEISREIGLLSQKTEPLPSLEFPEINEEIEYPSEEEIEALDIRENMLAYWMVLNNKRPFISMNEGGQKFYLKEYCWYLHSVEPEHYHANNFMIVDMDGDGLEEVVLECSPGTSEVLHYEEGEVYSYQFGTRGMKRIHISGIYEGSDGAASTSYCRLTELNKDGYTEETIAVMDRDYYEVEGEEATHEELSDYVKSIESVELAERMEFTESMFDRQLLGSLSEEEIALVKRIPAENMIENEPNYQEYKLALQSYAGVLKGEEEIIYVIEDTFWDELSWVYFSIVDMDGDGVNELVYTSDHDVIQILHYEEGKVYSYQLRPDTYETAAITTDGVFQTDDLSSTGYAKIVSFDKDGCEIEPIEDYESSSHDRIRYYYFSEEAINQWLAPEKPIENLIISKEEDTDFVYYLRDEKVDEIHEFSDFLDGKISAYDNKRQGNQYCIEYYEKFMEDHHGIFAIEIVAEDINEDGKCELLIILMYAPDQGDLYVFHEQNGRLYAWEVLENFYTMRVGEVYLLENGTFEFFGGYGQGHFYKRYNADGEIEDVLNYYYNSYPYEGKIQYDYVLTTYEQGVPKRELKYSMIAPADKLPNEGELSLGTKEEQEECNRILNKFYAESERVRWFKFPQNEDDVEEISLDNVFGHRSKSNVNYCNL